MLKRIVVTGFVFVLAALAVEGLARLFLSELRYEPVVPNIGQFDATLGWSKIPLASGASSRTGYPIEYAINSKGLRDDETSYEKPAGTFRIVLLGDSHTFGWGVPIDKHFSTLLESYFENVEVINMGVEGFGVDQELIYLRTEGFRYEPDMVIAYVPHYAEARHMYANRFGKDKPRFILVDGQLVLTNSPVVNSRPVQTSGLVRNVDRWLVSRSLAYQILHDSLLNWLRRAPVTEEAEQAPPANAEPVNFDQEMNELGEAIIKAMDDDSKEHGAAFVLITQIDELHQAAIGEQIFSYDVSEAMSNPAFALPQGLKHFNEAGNGVLAWEIARYLRHEQLMPAPVD